MRTSQPGAARRAGFTLTELMITVVLFGLVMAVLMSVIVRQQKFYRSANEIIDTRTQLRQAASVLPLDLRAVSSIGNDIKSISDSSITVLATFGTGIVCSMSGNDLVLTPSDLALHSLTSWHTQPVQGDTVFLYDEGGLRGSEDDSWSRLAVNSTATQNSGCNEFLNPDGSESTKARHIIRLTTTPTGTVMPGAAVRFARPVRYRFYQASDRQWYLGHEQYVAGSWGTVQPLAGPFRAYETSGVTSGLRFQYYRDDGTRITGTSAADRQAIARVDLDLRGQGANADNVADMTSGQFKDALVVRVAIRNRD